MSEKQQNILLIISDQLSAQALSAWGSTETRTPSIDRIMARGVRFESAYCTFPLCQPSRASFWTSRYPHETRVESNGREFPVEEVGQDIPTLGDVFSAAGYRTVHFGKTHAAGTLRGFECVPIERTPVEARDETLPVNYDTENDRGTTRQTVEFLSKHGNEPYFAVADLQNPHDICSWIGNYQDGAAIPDLDDPLPALPTNLHREEGEFESLPLPIQYICCAHNRQAQIGAWDERKVRYYLRAYYHYVDRLDTEIGRILQALDQREDAADTLVVFMVDHGDSMCGRWMATKHTSFYEETMHIPLVFAGPGVCGAGRVQTGLVSLLDLVPTLCEYAGLPTPEGARGLSLVPQLRGEDVVPRGYVAAEWHTEWGFTIEPGRMIRTPGFKYTHYLEGAGEELYDLEKDPGEIRNVAKHAEYAKTLEKHRALLHQHLVATDDDYLSREWKADRRWRSHKPGYRNHRGVAAPAAT